MAQVEYLRPGRTLVCFFTFDRGSVPQIAGLTTQFNYSAKEAIFRVLKESVPPNGKVDLCLYTRGGDINAVWPIVSIIREFDPEFEILVPFRCHSAGTITALGARRIVMTPLAELSPIDPSVGNQFNPSDQSGGRLAISVEDVQAYRNFIVDQFRLQDTDEDVLRNRLQPFLVQLTAQVHPLALGNVHRSHQQIKRLAKKLLEPQAQLRDTVDTVIDNLATRFYSHQHMINRYEAREILGDDIIQFAPAELANVLDDLLRGYENDFELTKPFFLASALGNKSSEKFRFIGGAVESRKWSYLYETIGTARQFTKLPSNIQVQIQPGQTIPLVDGLPREIEVQITGQHWMRNVEPLGVTK